MPSRPPKIVPLPARPEAAGPPDPPAFLDARAREEWARIAPALWRSGRLPPVAVGPLAAYAAAFSRWRAAEEEIAREAAAGESEDDGLIVVSLYSGRPRANPLLKEAATACREMVRYAAQFAMTPVSRTAIGNSAAHR
jgi:P27 family predicted phage terminase small subunit